MQLVRSPLAQAGSNQDLERKKWRLVLDPDELSATERYTVRDYSEGLAGLFWRNFFGPPFVQMLGRAPLRVQAGTR
jgi:hypothetical protein